MSFVSEFPAFMTLVCTFFLRLQWKLKKSYPELRKLAKTLNNSLIKLAGSQELRKLAKTLNNSPVIFSIIHWIQQPISHFAIFIRCLNFCLFNLVESVDPWLTLIILTEINWLNKGIKKCYKFTFNQGIHNWLLDRMNIPVNSGTVKLIIRLFEQNNKVIQHWPMLC